MKSFKPRIVLTLTVLVLIILVVVITINSLKNPSATNPQPEASTLAASAENTGYLNESSPSASIKLADIEDYIYQGAQLENQSNNHLELTITAPSDTVTNWYKEKLKSLNFNAKSFTQTNTNGSILNKLSAAKPGEKIEITIKKDQNSSIVMITVDRS